MRPTNWVHVLTNPNTQGDVHGSTINQRGVEGRGGSKICLHNAVVAALAKRINSKGFVATPKESVIRQTVHKQADITVIRQADISKPFYVDVTVIQ